AEERRTSNPRAEVRLLPGPLVSELHRDVAVAGVDETVEAVAEKPRRGQSEKVRAVAGSGELLERPVEADRLLGSNSIAAFVTKMPIRPKTSARARCPKRPARPPHFRSAADIAPRRHFA